MTKFYPIIPHNEWIIIRMAYHYQVAAIHVIPRSKFIASIPYYPHRIYHSILSSWDIPLHIILMGYTTPYYPHAFYTLLSSWQDNPPPPPQYSYIILLTYQQQFQQTGRVRHIQEEQQEEEEEQEEETVDGEAVLYIKKLMEDWSSINVVRPTGFTDVNNVSIKKDISGEFWVKTKYQNSEIK